MEQLAPMEKRRDKVESVVEVIFTKMTRIDENLDNMAKRFRDEDEAKRRSHNASLGGGSPPGTKG